MLTGSEAPGESPEEIELGNGECSNTPQEEASASKLGDSDILVQNSRLQNLKITSPNCDPDSTSRDEDIGAPELASSVRKSGLKGSAGGRNTARLQHKAKKGYLIDQ